MAIVSPIGWLQNVGSVNSAQIMRMADGGAVKGSALLTGLAGRGGVLQRASGNNMKLLQVGGGNMTVNVEPGICYVPGSEAFTQMGYWVLNDATLTTSAFTTAHASLNRIDTVYVKVNDSIYSGVSNNATVLIKDGTAGSGVAGSLAGINNVLKLGEVTVRAGATSILTSDILDNSRYLTAPGGVTPIRGGEETEAGHHGSEVSIFGGNLRYWDGSGAAWRSAMLGKFGSTAAISSSGVTPLTEDLHYITATKNFNRWNGSAWVEWVPTAPTTQLRATIAQSLLSNGTYNPVNFDTEDQDDLNAHSTVSNTSRFTCPATMPGRYRLNGGWSWPNTTGAAGRDRGAAFLKNGVLVPGSALVANAINTTAHGIVAARETIVSLIAGDYVELASFQNNGVAFNSQVTSENQPTFTIEFIGS
jgi:hypothetical protein